MKGWPSNNKRVLKEFVLTILDAYGCDCKQRGVIGGEHVFDCPLAGQETVCPKCSGIVERLKDELEKVNRMLRESQGGQGPIDAYVAQCEELDRYKNAVKWAINELAKPSNLDTPFGRSVDQYSRWMLPELSRRASGEGEREGG